MHIAGESVEAARGEWFDSMNPATGENWAQFPKADASDVDRAVQAAHRAFEEGAWPRLTASARGQLLHRLGDLIAENAEWLADLEVRDNGKLRAEMLGQMKYLPQWFYYYGGLADKVEGAVTPIDKPGMFHYITYEPLGVIAAIAPWNSPLLLAAWKIAPALAAGNTIVVKPSEFSSASTVFFAELVAQAGFPPGVFNVVTGFGLDVGEPLVKHPRVAKVAFTGSESGGRSVYLNAAADFKRVSLELGGKSANIVFADAVLDDAIKGIVSGIFAATGQTCMAGSRLLVQREIHDEVVARLVDFMKTAKLGDPLDKNTDIGAINSAAQLERVTKYIEIGRAEGAVIGTVLGPVVGHRPRGAAMAVSASARPRLGTWASSRPVAGSTAPPACWPPSSSRVGGGRSIIRGVEFVFQEACACGLDSPPACWPPPCPGWGGAPLTGCTR